MNSALSRCGSSFSTSWWAARIACGLSPLVSRSRARPATAAGLTTAARLLFLLFAGTTTCRRSAAGIRAKHSRQTYRVTSRCRPGGR